MNKQKCNRLTGKILLHKTKLKLLRGRRYALVGQNGVGYVAFASYSRDCFSSSLSPCSCTSFNSFFLAKQPS
jgi:ABC-type hemin transport system ATPase subunit